MRYNDTETLPLNVRRMFESILNENQTRLQEREIVTDYSPLHKQLEYIVFELKKADEINYNKYTQLMRIAKNPLFHDRFHGHQGALKNYDADQDEVDETIDTYFGEYGFHSEVEVNKHFEDVDISFMQNATYVRGTQHQRNKMTKAAGYLV